MQDPIHETIKAVYQEELAAVQVPPFPAPRMLQKPRSRKNPLMWIPRAAVVFFLLAFFSFAFFNKQQTPLARLITEAGIKYELNKRIPQGVRILQNAYQAAFIQ